VLPVPKVPECAGDLRAESRLPDFPRPKIMAGLSPQTSSNRKPGGLAVLRLMIKSNSALAGRP
jgi:hypothetical protein